MRVQTSVLLLGVFLVSLIGVNRKATKAEQGEERPVQSQKLTFLRNQGQFDDAFLYQTFGGPYHVGLAADAIWIMFPQTQAPSDAQYHPSEPVSLAVIETITIRLAFSGAKPHPILEPMDKQPANYSFFTGQDSAGWVTNASGWRGVRYVDLFPGVDLELAASPQGLIFHWVVDSHPDRLRPELTISGGALQGGPEGQPGESGLPIQTTGGFFYLQLPASNLPMELSGTRINGEGVKINLPASLPMEDDHGQVSSRYPTQAVTLTYGTYLGGALWDEANGVAVDPSGNLYLAGHTLSPVFPAVSGIAATTHNVDAFVARIDSASGEIGYLDVFQGTDLQNGEEWAMSIAVDDLGNAYTAGRTNSPAFPVTPDAFDTSYNGDWDVFALKLSPSGGLAYATFVGGTQLDWGTDLAIDGSGNAYITGGTFSDDFPTSPGAINPSLTGSRDIFLARLSPDGTDLTYGTYIGGTGQEQGESLALSSANALYLTGWTNSTDFPTTAGAFAEDSNGGFDAFVIKLTPENPALLYATYLGGTEEDRGSGIAVEPDIDEAVIGGRTNSENFPITPGALAGTLGGGTCDFSTCPDGFLVRLGASGSGLVYATFLGGSGWDEVRDATFGEGGEMIVSGETQSSDFPVTPNGFDTVLGGDRDGFFTVFAPGVHSLLQSSFLGGENWDSVNDSSTDETGQIILTGKTLSTDFPITPDAYAAEPSGDYDAFAVLLTLPRPVYLFLPLLQQ